MPTKTRTEKSAAAATTIAKPKRNLMPTIIVVGVIAAIVVIAGVVAVLASGGDDQSADAVAEQLSVTVSGNPLPPYQSGSGLDTSIGSTAPTLLGSAFDGSPLAVTPGGSPKLLVFLAHWCPACNEEVPHLVDWEKSGRVPEDLEVIGVSTSVRVGAPNYPPSRWVARRAWPWPIMADSPNNDAAAAYGVTGFPTSVVVGSDGTVLDRVSGVLGQEAYEAFVANALTRDVAATG
jgi:cytochrome c biogenesis protein CcmG, thiol:disulfide interchange protein DsbE